MKKNLLLICAALLLTTFGNSQNWQWAKPFGGSSEDSGEKIARDKSGNLYVTGWFKSTAIFGTTTLTSVGGKDFFIVKLDNSGNLLWAKSAGSISDDEGRGIVTDDSNNVYVTGTFKENTSFGNFSLTWKGFEDIFIVKYDSSGTEVWAKQAGMQHSDISSGIALDNNNNVYIIGNYRDSTEFDNIKLINTGKLQEVFVTKYSSSGNVEWAQSFGGNGMEYGIDLAVNNSGEIFATGFFEDTTVFGNLSLPSNGTYDVFLVKLDADGNPLWAQKCGGADYDYVRSLATDGNNAFITGSFPSSATFGTITISSAGSDDVFIAKYDGSGTALWAKSGGTDDYDYGKGISVDNSGNVYVIGSVFGFPASATFSGINVTGYWAEDIFVAKFNSSNGNVQWVKLAGGNNSDYGYGIVAGENDNAYMTGSFWSTPAKFGTININSLGQADVFLAEISTATDVTEKYFFNDFSIFPNPANEKIYIGISSEKIFVFELFDVSGVKILCQEFTENSQISFHEISQGIYFYKLSSENKIGYGKIIKH